VKFANADVKENDEAHRPPSLLLFTARVFLNDVLSVGILRITDVLVYAVLYTILLHQGWHPILSAIFALILSEVSLVLSCVAMKKVLIGSEWGSDHSTPFWSWRHFIYFFVQDCFFAWCRIPLAVSAGTVLPNMILRWMGCRIGRQTIVASPMQAFDWNAVSVGCDCIVAGVLQFHTLENMTLKVKRAVIQDGSSINFGATVMGGAVIGSDTTLLPLSLVLKEMHLPTGAYGGSPAEPVSSVQYSSPFIHPSRQGRVYSKLHGGGATTPQRAIQKSHGNK
jgi:carbonic anhydrase/acetyltransferase-like protein (isoleucine patch superfamily)